MKRINYLFLLVSVLAIFSCSKNDFANNDITKMNLIIKSDKVSLVADNIDVISFSAEQDSKDFTNKTTFYIDGVKIDGHTFKTSEVKEFVVYGMIGEKKSAEIKFSSVKDKGDTENKDLFIKSDKASLIADNIDVINFSAEQDAMDCTERTEFYIDGVKIDGHTFKTSEVKEFVVYGMIGENKSAEIKFSSIKDDSENKDLFIKSDKASLIADNIDVINFSAEQDAMDCTERTEFYIDGVKIDGHTFKTSEVKEFVVYGMIGENKSAEFKFSSTEMVDNSEKFVHKVLIEDYTVSWCGSCPAVIDAIDKYSYNNNFIPVALHYEDEMSYSKIDFLKNKFSVRSFPTAIINRVKSKHWYRRDPKRFIKEKAPISIALKTSVEGKEAKIHLKLNFDKDYKFTARLKVVIMLLEDDIIADQANFLSGDSKYSDTKFYNLPNPVKNFHHNHVLRVTATDIMGDLIPDEYVDNCNEYKKSYSIDLSDYNVDKCHIVAFIDQEDTSLSLGVLNAQRVKLGSSIFY